VVRSSAASDVYKRQIETIASEVVGIIAARVGTTRLIDNATFAPR
jgi:pantothenate synthetase